MENSWLALNEYSSKYKVSVSTLRRRIKATDIHYRLEDGKYFIIDEPISAHQRTHRPSQDPTSTLVSTSSPSPLSTEKRQSSMNSSTTSGPKQKADQSKDKDLSSVAEVKPKSILRANKDEPILTAANRLLNELKKAYSQILQEKEEQIMQLKDEQADLKTLIRVLEGENQRLKNQMR